MSKIAIAYFSRTNTTKREAELLGQILNVTPVAIQPVQPYSDDDINWHDDNCRANREQNDSKARPAIQPVQLPDFDVLFLGYPTWWGVPPRLIDTFLESRDWAGKTIVPFTTSGSTPADRGGRALKQLLPNVDIRDAERTNGYHQAQLQKWLDQLQLN